MSKRIEVLVPQSNPNDEHAVLVRWHVERGDRVATGARLATLETSKAAFDVEAPAEGFVFYSAAPSELIPVGGRLAWVCEDNVPPPADDDAPAAPQAAPGNAGASSRFTRKALQLMRQHGLGPDAFGDGKERVEVADVERLIRERGAGSGKTMDSEEAERLDQPPAKLLEIQALGEARRDAIPSLVSLSIAGKDVEARLRALAARHGPVSLLEIAIHAAARLLPDFPELNGYYGRDGAWRYRAIAIGFAINLGRSLRVPVVHDAGRLSLVETARAVRELSLAYMRDELKMPELTGGTFTITDLSAQGAEYFVPVVNRRQSAILGICAERPGTGHRDLVLAFDHRMTDGMRAAVFLSELRARLLEGEIG
jgi:pyruvate/2-oxoglutarate dehydrogenase complex dihydrolipoamide acyltransferase (E2) component